MKVDVLVIGSGQAGVPLATRFAHAGKQVVLVERAELGGTCINYGCTPTKTMVASAKVAHVARTGAPFGVHTGEVHVDFPAVVARKNEIVRQWHTSIARRLEAAKPRLRVLHGTACFVDERQVEVLGQRISADVVVVNTGVRPALPRLPGLAALAWLDNHTLMDLPSLPRHLLVLGGGYIGCEFAQMFRRFGAEVTVTDHHPHLLSREDPDVAEALEGVFRDEGICLQLGAEVREADRSGDDVVLTTTAGELRGSHLLVATGRHPNTDDLACERGGVALDAHGFIKVDDGYRTTAKGVYAVGDVAGGPQFTHTSWDDHRLLYDLLRAESGRGRASRLVPYTVYTDPQVARVGLNETDARQRKIAYEAASLPFASIARAIETGETAGTMKVLLDPKTQRFLGATLVGADAGELIHVFVALMQAKANAHAIVDAEFVHPTYAEGLQKLVMSLDRYKLD